MDTDDILPSPEFLRVFGAWFSVDQVDLGDDAEVTSAAASVAAELLQQGETADEIAAAVTETLAQWSPVVAAAFNEATDMDWLADEASEEQLKSILAEISDAAEASDEDADAV